MGNNSNKKEEKMVFKKEMKNKDKYSEMKRFKKGFYALLIGIAVISFWRGIWGLWDVYVFPNNYSLSLVTSVIVGLIILLFTHKVIRELM